MALPFNFASATDSPRPADAWAGPITAAIVMCGVVTVSCLAGVFWLADRSAQAPIVIWVPAASVASHTTASVPPTTVVADHK